MVDLCKKFTDWVGYIHWLYGWHRIALALVWLAAMIWLAAVDADIGYDGVHHLLWQ